MLWKKRSEDCDELGKEGHQAFALREYDQWLSWSEQARLSFQEALEYRS